MTPILEARALSKVYRVYPRAADRLLEALTRRPRHREFVALSDVSLELTAGESLGIIGENGAGKSTLLKMLAGITMPTSGELSVRGKVASILELGSGFHPDLTGRQNILLNGALLGLSEVDLRRLEPEIVDFSELGEFIDEPVKHYSTGMVVRLGFAIATQVDPEILIIDEALSVGDGYFQKKCMDRLLTLVGNGKTLLFCSHAMYYVTAFCRRALWLKNGRVEALGPAVEVVRRYESFLEEKELRTGTASVAEARSAAHLREVTLLDGVGHALTEGEHALPPRSALRLEIAWRCEREEVRCHVGVGIDRADGVQIASFATHLDGQPAFTGKRSHQLLLDVPELPMLRGQYTVYVFLLDENGLHIYDQHIRPRAFRIEGEEYRIGLLEIPHRWTMGPAPTTHHEVPMPLVHQEMT